MQEGFEEKLCGVGKLIRRLWKPGRVWNEDKGYNFQFAPETISEVLKVAQLTMVGFP